MIYPLFMVLQSSITSNSNSIEILTATVFYCVVLSFLYPEMTDPTFVVPVDCSYW